MKTIECRCVLIQPRSHALFAFADAGRYHLPRVYIPQATRPAQQVQKAIKAKWGLNIFVMEIWGTPDDLRACAVAELMTPESASPLREVPLEQLTTSEFFEQEYRRLQSLIEGEAASPLSRLGWIDEAIVWMESATGRTFRSGGNIEQWNAGGGFGLFCACSDDGRQYWLKATGEPNAHEFAITLFLCDLCPDFLPKLVAVKETWNAWLTEHAGGTLPDAPSLSELVSVTRSMAQLQFLTIGQTDKLLSLGAFDQRLPALRSHIDAAIAHLIEAMAQQASTKAAPLGPDRLLELREILRNACSRLEALDMPDTLIHNDLNAGNILSDGANYVFTDWSEATVGNPFLACERLCQLNPAHAESVRKVYRECWSHRLSAQSMNEAIALAPLLAIYAYLYGRGDWLGQSERVRPQFESYATFCVPRRLRRVRNEAEATLATNPQFRNKASRPRSLTASRVQDRLKTETRDRTGIFIDGLRFIPGDFRMRVACPLSCVGQEGARNRVLTHAPARRRQWCYSP